MRLTVSGWRIRAVVAALVGLAITFQASQVQAGGCPACVGKAAGQGPVGCVSGYQLIERTIQVPTMVTERRLVNVTECRTETRERTVTVRKMIPEIKQVRDMCVVMVPHVETRVERYKICVPTYYEVVQDVTVQVSTQELRKGTRTVCRQVQVQEMCMVTRDRGHWEEVEVDPLQNAGCDAAIGCGFDRRWIHAGGGCGICRACRSSSFLFDRYQVGYDAGCVSGVTQQIQRVWKPDIVTEQIPVTVCRNQVVEEPYEYHVTVYHPEVRQQTVRVCKPVIHEQEREVQVTVCVPTKRELVRNISTYRTVCEPQVQRYNVRVPYTVQREVDVQVCRLMPKTVVCRVPVTAPSVCHDCGGGVCRHCGR